MKFKSDCIVYVVGFFGGEFLWWVSWKWPYCKWRAFCLPTFPTISTCSHTIDSIGKSTSRKKFGEIGAKTDKNGAECTRLRGHAGKHNCIALRCQTFHWFWSQDFQFKLHHKIVAFKKCGEPRSNVNLLAVSSSRGLLFAGSPTQPELKGNVAWVS